MDAPRVSFAVLTDIHYADHPPNLKLDYRGSWDRLSRAVESINAARPEFAIQLGDLVDCEACNLPRILSVYRTLAARQYHVLGNHDFCVPRAELQQQLRMQNSWYDFAAGGWRFIVLDGMDVSIPGRTAGTPEQEAAQTLAALRARNAPNAHDWNGGIGEAQQRWIRDTLQRARGAGERAIVFCHFPLLPEAATPEHLLWNSEEILRILRESPAVAAYMNGHAHDGGYAMRDGIHFVTFPGMVESGDRNSYTLVDVYDDRLELRGSGTAPSRSLPLPPRSR
jgi:3',5'-cyclic AMP phosphodiesterase CpdA